MVNGYGSSASSAASAAAVTSHSARIAGSAARAASVSSTIRSRASAPTRCAAQPAVTIAATVWLAAEWVTPVAAASSRTLAGPSASTRTTGENRGR